MTRPVLPDIEKHGPPIEDLSPEGRRKAAMRRMTGFHEQVKDAVGKDSKFFCIVKRVLIGTYVLAAGYYDAYYIKAQRVRARIAEDFDRAFERCDVILTPTAPSAAFAIGEKMDDPIAMYLNDVFTVPASLAGIPGASVPAGLSADGLPLGLQVLTRRWDEETLFRVCQALEDAAQFPLLPAV